MELVPKELVFDLIHPNPVCFLKIKNTSKDVFAFAIRTTNLLETFKFKPSKAVVKPGDSLVFRATMKEEHRQLLLKSKEYRCTDGFVIVHTPVDSEFLEKLTGLGSKTDERRALIDQTLSTAKDRRKLFFKAVLVPPSKLKSSSDLSKRRPVSPKWIRGRQAAASSLVSLSQGAVIFTGQDVGETATIKVVNRSDFYVIIHFGNDHRSNTESRFASVDPIDLLIPPRKSLPVEFTLFKRPRDGLVLQRFALVACNVLDPNILDDINTSRPETHERIFKRFWAQQAARRRTWTAALECRVDPDYLPEPPSNWLLFSCTSKPRSVNSEPLGLIQKQVSLKGEELNLETYESGDVTNGSSALSPGRTLSTL